MIWALFLVFVVIFIWAMPFRPGLLRARLRSVACGEPSPAYPYRIFFVKLVLLSCFWAMFFWNYFLMELCFGGIIWAMPLEKKIIFSMFWAMPSSRATTGSLCSVAFGEPSPAYPYRIFLDVNLVFN